MTAAISNTFLRDVDFIIQFYVCIPTTLGDAGNSILSTSIGQIVFVWISGIVSYSHHYGEDISKMITSCVSHSHSNRFTN